MVAVISSHFGLQHIEMAEDIVSETFLQAAESWRSKGLPPNPPAWLYTVAKQKTLYHFRRNKIYTDKVLPFLKEANTREGDSFEMDFRSLSNGRQIFLQCLEGGRGDQVRHRGR